MKEALTYRQWPRTVALTEMENWNSMIVGLQLLGGVNKGVIADIIKTGHLIPWVLNDNIFPGHWFQLPLKALWTKLNILPHTFCHRCQWATPSFVASFFEDTVANYNKHMHLTNVCISQTHASHKHMHLTLCYSSGQPLCAKDI